MEDKTAVFIGRFQPFHNGHLHTLKEMVRIFDAVYVVVGSSDQNFTSDNPLTIAERLEMVRTVVEKNKWEKKVKHIVPFEDVSDNVLWVHKLVSLLPPFDTVVSHNDLVVELFSHLHKKTYQTKLVKRDIWQGTVIRDAVRKNNTWEDKAPSYIVPLLKRFDFEKRI